MEKSITLDVHNPNFTLHVAYKVQFCFQMHVVHYTGYMCVCIYMCVHKHTHFTCKHKPFCVNSVYIEMNIILYM